MKEWPECNLCKNDIADFPLDFTDLWVCGDCYNKAIGEPNFVEEMWRDYESERWRHE